MTLPVAIFADRWARRKMIAVMDIVWSTFTLVTAFSTQLWHLLVSRFMVGAGEAGYVPAGMSWLSVVFPKEKRGRIMGVFTMFNPVGTALGLMIGGLLISATGNWRIPFYFFGIPGFLLAIWVFMLPDYKVQKQAGEAMLSKSFFNDYGKVFRIKSFWCITVANTFIYFFWFAALAWLPTLVQRAFNLDAGAAGMTLGLLSFIYIVGPLGGICADKLQKRIPSGRALFTAVMSLAVTVASFICWNTINLPFTYWIVIFAVTQALMAFVQPVNQTLMHDVVPVEVRATAFGTMNLIAQLFGGMTGPFVLGAISDRLGGGAPGIQGGLVAVNAVALVGIVVLFILTKFYPGDSSRAGDLAMAEK
jgi:MFS family permease